eukprot:tig00021108_g18314.t1
MLEKRARESEESDDEISALSPTTSWSGGSDLEDPPANVAPQKRRAVARPAPSTALLSLPHDLLVRVLHFCDARTLCACKLVCKTFRKLAPVAALPRCAKDILAKANQQTLPDGEYTCYFQGDYLKPFQLYCKFSEDPPTEWLSLRETPSHSLSTHSVWSPGSWGPQAEQGSEREYTIEAQGTKLRTVFTKLRFDGRRGLVKIDDFSFAESTGQLTIEQTGPDGLFFRCPVTTAPLGSVRCADTVAKSRIDLRGTPFCVRSNFTGVQTTRHIKEQDCAWTLAYNGQVVVMTCREGNAIDPKPPSGALDPTALATSSRGGIAHRNPALEAAVRFSSMVKPGGWIVELDWCPAWAEQASPPAQDPACAHCRKNEGSNRMCSACLTARYCSRDCQTQDWKTRHKFQCSRK